MMGLATKSFNGSLCRSALIVLSRKALLRSTIVLWYYIVRSATQ